MRNDDTLNFRSLVDVIPVFRPENPFRSVRVFLSSSQHSTLFKLGPRGSLHICVQTLGDVGKLPALLWEAGLTESTFHPGAIAFEQSNYLRAHLFTESHKLPAFFCFKDREIRFIVALRRMLLFPLFRLAEQLTLHQFGNVSVDAGWRQV